MIQPELPSQTQRELYELATQGVEVFIRDLGRFTPFALAYPRDGQIQILETSGEFPDDQSAQEGLISHLKHLRDETKIVGALLCAPVTLPSNGVQVAVVMEIEAAGHPPIRVMRQMQNAFTTPVLAEKVTTMAGEGHVF
jgi:hypothetical protein